MTPDIPERLRAAKGALDVRLAEIGGCSDGHCKVVKPVGMHTNGGCRCLRHPFTAERVVYAYRQAFEALLSATPDPEGEGQS